MTKAPAKTAQTDIDPEAQYEVALKRPIKVGGRYLQPLNTRALKGKLIIDNLDAVDTYTLIE